MINFHFWQVHGDYPDDKLPNLGRYIVITLMTNFKFGQMHRDYPDDQLPNLGRCMGIWCRG